MLMQFGALFSGLATGLGQIAQQVLPAAIDIGKTFLQREINRKDLSRQRRQQSAQAVAALNTPGISVARVGGTVQPVGGRVQRSTFTPAAMTPAQSPFGNIPLLPVGFLPSVDPRQTGLPGLLRPAFKPRGAAMPNGQGPLNLRFQVGGVGAAGEPKFARDEFGRTINFVPMPSGNGFISVQQARANNLSAAKPWWRWNRLASQYERIKPRRMNPFNFKAASRAGRRIERTLDAIKKVVTIQRKVEKGVSAGGKVVKFRTKKRKRA